MSTDWINSLRVVDLKDELKKRELAVGGKKAELIERLTEAVLSENAEKPVEEEAQEDGATEVTEAEAPEEQDAAAPEPANEPSPPATDALPPAEQPDRVKATQAVQDKADEPSTVVSPVPAVTDATATPVAAVPLETTLQAEAQPVQDVEPVAEPAVWEDTTMEEAVNEPLAPAAKETDAEPLLASKHEVEVKPDALEVTVQAEPAAQVIAVKADAEAEAKAEEKLPDMQAALLAPSADVVPMQEEEEELVDFEVDEPAEPVQPESTPPLLQVKVETGKRGLEASEGEPASKKLKEEPHDSATPEPGKRKRMPIPMFNAADRLAGQRDSTPGAAPDNRLSSKKSIFDRVTGLSEEPVKGPGAPPSRVKASKALHVTGFIRPFTLQAAQALFQKHGNLEQFWMPRIRDMAYIVFESEEAAESARQAIHGLLWPSGTATSLRVRFVDPEEAKTVIANDGKTLAKKGSGLTQQGSGHTFQKAAADALTPAAKRKAEPANGNSTEPKKVKRETAEKPEEKVVMLEDLFRKTEAVPHLYWLPLTAEQIAAKRKGGTQAEKGDIAEKRERREEGEKRRPDTERKRH